MFCVFHGNEGNKEEIGKHTRQSNLSGFSSQNVRLGELLRLWIGTSCCCTSGEEDVTRGIGYQSELFTFIVCSVFSSVCVGGGVKGD